MNQNPSVRWSWLALPVVALGLQAAYAKDFKPVRRGPIAGVSGGRILFNG